MKRMTSVIFAILLGGFAVGIGVVPFLVLANQDRDRLYDEIQTINDHAEKTEAEKKKIAEEADAKVREANTEITRAQAILRETEEDQKLMLAAEKIEKPSSRTLNGWKSVVSLSQDTELLIPPKSLVLKDNAKQLLVQQTSAEADIYESPFSISIEPYNKQREHDILLTFTSSTEIAYVANSRLLKGWSGFVGDADNQNTAMLFRVRDGATSTHTLFITAPEVSKTTFETILGTIQFHQ